MESFDIRDHCDITDAYECRIAADALVLQLPRDCLLTSGLDSLVVVIRRIYSYVMLGRDGRANSELVKKAENENPILRYAWSLMGPSDEEQEAASRARAEVIREVGGHDYQGVDFKSFEDLCTSQLMNKTFWSQKDFCLYYPVFSLDRQDCLEQSPEEKATESIVHLDRIENPQMSLQDAVNSEFGVFDSPVGELIYRPSQPLVIRVLLRTNGDKDYPDNHLRFSDLQRFFLPQQEPAEASGGWYLEEGKPLGYTIMAVVKMRDDGAVTNSEQDKQLQDVVRTYAPNRIEILPAYEDKNLMSDKWSVEDVRDYEMQYMLFYTPYKPGSMEDHAFVPERSQPPIYDEEMWNEINAMLDPIVEELNKAEASRAERDISEDMGANASRSQTTPAETMPVPGSSTIQERTPAPTTSSTNLFGGGPSGPNEGLKHTTPQPSQEQLFDATKGRNGCRR